MRGLISTVILLIFSMALSNAESYFEKATFAGGCFWCMEAPFEELDGVIDVKAGYTGGHKENPTYDEVSSGKTGHYEVIQVTYDSAKITYEELLNVFWRQVDPTDPDGQFVDKGSQYRTAIFYHSEKQKELADKSKELLEKSSIYDKPIVTKVIKFDKFYPAEEYHQDYYKKCPIRYQTFKENSGRADFLNKIWGSGNKR